MNFRLGYMKGAEFLDQLGDYQVLNKKYTPWTCM
jgi:hypothetical protein